MNISSKNQNTTFTARQFAVVKPLADAISADSHKPIEIYTLGRKDKDFMTKFLSQINMERLLPSKRNKKNFSVWQDLIQFMGDFMGTTARQRVFLAVQDKKPCGMLVSVCNKRKCELVGFATWPVGVEQKVKNAGRALFTAFLDVVSAKKCKNLKLEPILQGPTDAVGFYKKMGLEFKDPHLSTMSAGRKDILATFAEQVRALNYKKISKSPQVSLEFLTGFSK